MERHDVFEIQFYRPRPGQLASLTARVRDELIPQYRRFGLSCRACWVSLPSEKQHCLVCLLGGESKIEDTAAKQREADPAFREVLGRLNDSLSEPVTSYRFSSQDSALKLPPTKSGEKQTFDLRLYTVIPGKLLLFTERWHNHAERIYQRYGLHSWGYGILRKNGKPGERLLLCLLSGKSLDNIQRAIGQFHADTEWQRIERETEKDGPLRAGVEAFKLAATDFSPIQ